MIFIGVQLWTFGIGPEGLRVSKELTMLASSPRYAIAGGVTSLIQKQAFTSLSGGLMKSEYASVGLFFCI